ncbi:hypothetical protein IE81DRAFT_95644 [Ceraceosorus guamensis]|uniref:Uncharacterized protein n=1 Tax=Ceraceosorus guamensis TaxID=1522189 RepID=A0A316W0U7_9BASI|nr:hypothetical protein IE81DRAFT_95644 [Ceraceosorus guamensis]PWN43319.1 hypothetical protein IE81DRAFT_95644 [Ceraceosorus guamensis]
MSASGHLRYMYSIYGCGKPPHTAWRHHGAPLRCAAALGFAHPLAAAATAAECRDRDDATASQANTKAERHSWGHLLYPHPSCVR